jgi:hypothetical protein
LIDRTCPPPPHARQTRMYRQAHTHTHTERERERERERENTYSCGQQKEKSHRGRAVFGPVMVALQDVAEVLQARGGVVVQHIHMLARHVLVQEVLTSEDLVALLALPLTAPLPFLEVLPTGAPSAQAFVQAIRVPTAKRSTAPQLRQQKWTTNAATDISQAGHRTHGRSMSFDGCRGQLSSSSKLQRRTIGQKCSSNLWRAMRDRAW